MATASDITGRRFGGLTVIERAERIRFAGRYMWSWRARCDCGREETYPQKALSGKRGVRACSLCSRPICDICGKPFERTNPNQRRHDGECSLEAKRRMYRESYYKKVATIPGFNQRRAHADFERNPDAVRARRREANTRLREKVRTDADATEARRTYDREYQRARRQALRADPVAYAEWLAMRRERQRGYQAEWARQHRASMDDADRTQLKERRREWERLRSLSDLVALGERLKERLKNE